MAQQQILQLGRGDLLALDLDHLLDAVHDVDDFLAEGCGTRAEAFQAGEVVLTDDGIAHQSDDDGRDEGQVGDLVLDDGREEEFHGELWEHDAFVVAKDRPVEEAQETADWRAWSGRENRTGDQGKLGQERLFAGSGHGFQLMALGNDILV